jgi:uncharacterized protein YcfJ
MFISLCLYISRQNVNYTRQITHKGRVPMNIRYVVLLCALTSASAIADNSTLDAAIGGAIGVAAGAAIGNEICGRDGAIVGGALGGAVGAAVNTDENNDHSRSSKRSSYRSEPRYVYPASSFCPPGQAKKDVAST